MGIGKLLAMIVVVIAVIGGIFYFVLPDLFIQPAAPLPPSPQPPGPLPPPGTPGTPPPVLTPGANGCVVSGCSSQICSDQEVITTCEWKEEYACYRTARCQRQTDGRCGWTMTPELQQCLQSSRNTSPAQGVRKIPPTFQPQTSAAPVNSAGLPPSGPKPAAPQPKTLTISFTNAVLSPTEITIAKGDSIVFKNDRSQSIWPASNPHPAHSLYPEKGGCADSAFDSCRGIVPGESWSFQFNAVGSWPYHNHLNPIEQGTINVQ